MMHQPMGLHVGDATGVEHTAWIGVAPLSLGGGGTFTLCMRWVAMSNKKDKGNEVLIGVVTPIKWDGDQIAEVSLCATDDEEYHIENSYKFFDLVQQCIQATGSVQRTKKAFKSISIKKYKVIDSF
jgi:hypothetical protein